MRSLNRANPHALDFPTADARSSVTFMGEKGWRSTLSPICYSPISGSNFLVAADRVSYRSRVCKARTRTHMLARIRIREHTVCKCANGSEGRDSLPSLSSFVCPNDRPLWEQEASIDVCESETYCCCPSVDVTFREWGSVGISLVGGPPAFVILLA